MRRPFRRNPEPIEGPMFHVTTFEAMSSISSHGLRPRLGAGVFSHGGYGQHSQGRIFLADGRSAALAWYGKIQDMLWHENSDSDEPDPLVPVMLRVSLDSLPEHEPVIDPLGDRDVPGSYYATTPIPPQDLEFYSPEDGDWMPVEDWNGDPADGVESVEFFNEDGDPVEEDEEWVSRGFTIFGPYDDGGFKPSQDDAEAWE